METEGYITLFGCVYFNTILIDVIFERERGQDGEREREQAGEREIER